MDYFKANYLQLRGGLKENHGISVILLRYKPCNAGRQVFRVVAMVTCLVLKAEVKKITEPINPLNPELNPICYLLVLLGAHHFLHVSRIRVKSLTFRRLMSYIYGALILDVSRSHTTTQHSR